MNILLVGGTGCISTAVVGEAIKQKIEVSILNRGNRIGLIPDKVTFLKADVKNSTCVKSLLKNNIYDAIIDFICFDEKDIKYSFNLFKNNTMQYIFISSCAVHRYNNNNDPSKLNVWEYSVKKNRAENWLKENALRNGIPYTIVRPAVTYGDTRIPYGITPPYGSHWTFIERIKHGKPIITWNKGEDYCNITHASDFAIAFAGLLGNKNAYNEEFDIVGDETPKWKDVLFELENYIGVRVKTFDIPVQFYATEVPNKRDEILFGRAISMKYQNDKIKSIVPLFSQNILLKDGVKRTLDYYKKNNYINGIDYSFDGDCDRIILKYAKKNGDSVEDLNLKYIDYLGSNKQQDKYSYYLECKKDNFMYKCIKMLKRVF